jgi:hypothetical protein
MFYVIDRNKKWSSISLCQYTANDTQQFFCAYVYVSVVTLVQLTPRQFKKPWLNTHKSITDQLVIG